MAGELRGSSVYPTVIDPAFSKQNGDEPRSKKIKIEEPSVIVSEVHEPEFDHFLSWAVQNGAKFNKIKYVKFQKEGRGGLALDDFAAGEFIESEMNQETFHFW
jgi:hypothetical protein